MKKILCPVDFSANSLNAIEFAARIGVLHHSELTLIHVFTEKEFGEALSSGLLADRYKQTDIDNLVGSAEELLSDLTQEVNRLSQKKGLINCDYHFSYGPLEKHITHFAEEHGYTLIVMGTAGVKDIFEELAGSHTVKTLERAHCPVLCVPEKVKYKRFSHVVYATDYQDEDDDILRQLISFVQPFDASISVLHIYHRDNEMEDAMYKEYVEQVRVNVSYEKLQFTRMKFEDPAHGIDRFAIDQDADLVALYYKRRNILEQIFIEGTTKSLAYFATYPIIFFKKEHKADPI